MKRTCMALAVLLLALSACTTQAPVAPSSAPASAQQQPSALPTGLPPELQQKRVPLIAASLRVGQADSDTNKIASYLQTLGDTYTQAWVDYLGAPRPVFFFVRVYASTKTACKTGADFHTIEPNSPGPIACFVRDHNAAFIYAPVGEAASVWVKNGRTDIAEMIVAIPVARLFGAMMLEYLASARSHGTQLSPEAQKLVAICLGGIAFRATHNASEAQIRQAYDRLHSPYGVDSFLGGYKDGRVSQCYPTRGAV